MAKALGDDFQLVTPENLDTYLPPGVLHDGWSRLPQPALRADCLRAALLATHGGWWWDADTLAFQKPPEPRGPVVYMTWTRLPRRVLNGYIYMEKGYPLALRWLSRINHVLRTNPKSVDWCSLGESVLTHDVSNDSRALEISRSLFLPIDIDSNVEEFFTLAKWNLYRGTDTVCFGLNHSYFVYHHPKAMTIPPDRWKDSPLLVHQLLTYFQERINES